MYCSDKSNIYALCSGSAQSAVQILTYVGRSTLVAQVY